MSILQHREEGEMVVARKKTCDGQLHLCVVCIDVRRRLGQFVWLNKAVEEKYWGGGGMLVGANYFGRLLPLQYLNLTQLQGLSIMMQFRGMKVISSMLQSPIYKHV